MAPYSRREQEQLHEIIPLLAALARYREKHAQAEEAQHADAELREFADALNTYIDRRIAKALAEYDQQHRA